MQLIDTHTHLYLDSFSADREAVLERAIRAGVGRFYLPHIDSETTHQLLELEARHPTHCVAMMGLHPCSVNADFEKELQLVESWLGKRRFSAVGEIGLDYYWDKTYTAQQQEVFEQQIRWALHYSLPIVIHSRNSMAECIATVQKYQDGRLRGIFHCFGGSREEAQQIIGQGFLLGIGGVLTYKKSGLAEVLSGSPPEHLVLETDAPYLSPVPHRGKRNEPSYLVHILEDLSAATGRSTEELARITTANALKIFEG